MNELLTRVVSKIDAGLCWEWTDAPSQYGYGRLNVGGRAGIVWLAHRLVWTLLVGSIPEGYTLDHLCRNRICVNPDHMEVVTLAENKRRGNSPSALNARKTVCKRGHDLSDPTNLRPRTYRQCRLCHVLDEQERRRARKEVMTYRM